MSSQRLLQSGTTTRFQAAKRIDGKTKREKGTTVLDLAESKIQKLKRCNSEEHRNARSSKRPRVKTPKAQEGHDVNSHTMSTDRPAEPRRTNAPLVIPQGSRYVTSPTPKARLSQPTTTTENILDQACAHLVKMDSRMQPLIEKHHCRVFCPESLAEECDPFKSLCSGIMAQQVSGAAASSIKKKFISLFQESSTQVAEEPRPFPTPTAVAACSVPYLRQAGLSERKAEYIKGLAESFANGDLSASMLVNASDEEVLEKLTAVRGLGRWSVEMFACFGLKRMDILSTGDLGVQYVSQLSV